MNTEKESGGALSVYDRVARSPVIFRDIAYEAQLQMRMQFPELVGQIPWLEIHPKRIGAIGAYYEPEGNMVHVPIDADTLILLSGDTPEAVGRGILQRYREFLGDFVARHGEASDFSSIDLAMHVEKVDRTLKSQYWDTDGSYLTFALFPLGITGLSDEACNRFLLDTVFPLFAEDYFASTPNSLRTLLVDKVQSYYAHETGHAVFHHVMLPSLLLSDTDEQDVTRAWAQVDRKSYRGRIPEPDTVDVPETEEIHRRVNNEFIRAIAEKITDPKLRERHIRFAVIKGLNEDFARAFCMYAYGGTDYIEGSNLAYYALSRYVYLGNSRQRIDAILYALQQEGVGNIAGIIERFSAEALSTF